MSTFYSFDANAINEALAAARATHQNTDLQAAEANFNTVKGGDLAVHAQCIAVTIEDHKVCIDLPLGFGKHCISIPVNIPNGTAGKACLKICTTWGIPTGIKVTVEVAGITIVSQTFGKC